MYLLDTHTFLWAIDEPRRLSAKAKILIENPATQIFVSSVSAWEVFAKSALGKLPPTLKDYAVYQKAITSFSAHKLPITDEHCHAAANLPPHHRDPFDRLLIAQAQTERLTLITNDPAVQQYEVELLW